MSYIPRLQGFYIDRFEVTVGEYRRFLSRMRLSGNHALCHPQEKALFDNKDHTPKNWRLQRKYLAMPVVGVDFFDAYAFARWAGKKLPSLEEWRVAVQKRKIPSQKRKLGLGILLPIGSLTEDQTEEKVFDMYGNVREWVVDDRGTPFVCGGSYQLQPFPPKIPITQLKATHRDMYTGFRCVFVAK